MKRSSPSFLPGLLGPCGILALLGACLGAGCRTTGDAPPLVSEAAEVAEIADLEGTALAEEPPRPIDDGTPPLEDETAAIDAIRRGDYGSAHDILGRLLFAENLSDARALMAEDRPEDALLYTERALALRPKDPEARLVDARSRLRLAEKGIAAGRPFMREALEDALDAYRRAGSGPEARLGASRAAYLLGRSDEALTFAQEGIDQLGGRELDLDRMPHRVYAEAAYAAYVALKSDESAEPESVQALFLTTESALTSLLGRAAADPWVHTTLGYLYEWEQRLVDARDALMRGLDHIPNDRGMLDRLAAVARQSGGGEAALQTFVDFQTRHPDVAEGYWYVSYERFYLALEGLEGSDYRADEFRAAERGFARCRELEPSYDESCRGYEVMCRNAVGWCLYQAEDIEGAQAAFLSADDVLERGLEWEIEGRLLSGVLGLAFCAAAHFEREEWLAAAELNEHLRRYVPDEVTYANDAGFFYRDAAVELEAESKRLCRAAKGELTSAEAVQALRELAGVAADVPSGSPAERKALRRAANARSTQARELMRKSADAYVDAARLAPDDVRLINDTALVFVYYLHTELDEAERLLLRAVELGTEQLRDDALDEDARWELENAWGDAHQNLGVLFANHLGDKGVAARWFQLAADIGPEPRPVVSEFWLPYLRGEINASQNEELFATQNWARPCK
ncbi:MAG: hypothetical protein AAF682_26200 [Planctomycetota bacterium]